METRVKTLLDRFTKDSLSFQEIEDLYETHKADPIYETALRHYFDTKPYDEEIHQEITEYAHGFDSYPDPKQVDFYECISKKQEFGMYHVTSKLKEFQEACSRDFFELAPHQLFLKHWMSPHTPYRSLLVFHGVGVGKTCSGVSMAENFKDIYGNKDKRIIILASEPIQEGWQRTIYNPESGTSQCTGQTYHTDRGNVGNVGNVVSITQQESRAKKIIRTYYEISAYTAFANRVKRLLHSRRQREMKSTGATQEDIDIEERRIIREHFSDRMLIIDEVHNIRSSDDELSRDTLTYIMKVIKYSENLRLVLLTANPMFNQPDEIVWILNLMRANDSKPLIPTTIFSEGILTKEGETTLRNACKGCVSYLRGENPVAFPLRLYPKGPEILSTPYTSLLGDTHVTQKFLQLYSTQMDNLQLSLYQRAITSYGDTQPMHISFERETQLLQLGDIVFPHLDPDADLKEYYGGQGFDRCFTCNKGIYRYQSEIVKEYGEFLHQSHLPKYSCKFSAILDSINQSEGIIFVYTNWIKGSLVPFQLMCEQNGYHMYDSEPRLKLSTKTPSLGTYMVITPEQTNNKTQFKKLVAKVTSPDNADGSRIKIIIGSTVAAEGLDFKHVRAIHVLEPWRHLNKLEQVIGRGVRNCSHKSLPPEKRNATIYLHNAMLSPTQGSLDTYLYRYSEDKAIHIGHVETILKEEAIDQCLFQKMNMVLKKQAVAPLQVTPALRGSDSFTVYPYDKPYSRVCSFQPTCKYKIARCIKPTQSHMKDDTLHIEYSQGMIDVYKKRIAVLMSHYLSYTYQELKDRLSDYTEVYDVFLEYALEQMIQGHYPLTNSKGHMGRIVSKGDFFIFQPDYSNDICVPYYYRMQQGPVIKEFPIIKQREIRNSEVLPGFSFSADPDTDITQCWKTLTEAGVKLGGDDGISTIFTALECSLETRWGYIIDRYSFEEKVKLLYYVVYCKQITNPHITETPIYTFLDSHLSSQIIYYDPETETYLVYGDRIPPNARIFGYIVYHSRNKQAYIYEWSDMSVSLANNVDVYEILDTLRNSSSEILPIGNSQGPWGLMIYSSRYKGIYNGMVVKIVDPRDKLKKRYAYPPGPGIIANDPHPGNINRVASQPATFILQEFPEYLNTPEAQILKTALQIYEKESKQERKDRKKEEKARGVRDIYDNYPLIIECCIRKQSRILSQEQAWRMFI